MPDSFAVFNEIGIIAQLSRAVFEARLPDGVYLPHFSVLNHLARLGDGKTPLDLARAFQVPKTTMSHTLSGLVARDWIELRPNPDDGRSKQVWLTDAGRAFRDTAIGAATEAFRPVLTELPGGTLDALLPHLRNLRIVLDQNRPD